MQATLAELAVMVGGQLVGANAACHDIVISGAAPILDAGPGDITLFDSPMAAKGEHSRALAECHASAVVCSYAYVPQGFTTIQVDNVHHAFATIVRHFKPARVRKPVGISPQAYISPSAVLGPGVQVHPFATIGDDAQIGARAIVHAGVHLMDGCQIGEDVVIFPGAVLYEDTIVGARSIIHACAVIGAYGFGYEQVAGRHKLTSQQGNVILGEDVEIGAGSTIDRGTYGPTWVGDGTKIDDQVMVAHNCRIGKNNMLCSQVGIAGSTSTGDYVVLAGQVGVRDHVHIGSRSVIGAKGGVVNDVPEGSRLLGAPAQPERETKLQLAALSKLPEMRQQMKKLQRAVDELTAKEALALENAELEVAKRPAA
jgi:UDP-3-O-[3-hydroxymyristoyl] glucosamine N-acyltransferase